MLPVPWLCRQDSFSPGSRGLGESEGAFMYQPSFSALPTSARVSSARRPVPLPSPRGVIIRRSLLGGLLFTTTNKIDCYILIRSYFAKSLSCACGCATRSRSRCASRPISVSDEAVNSAVLGKLAPILRDKLGVLSNLATDQEPRALAGAPTRRCSTPSRLLAIRIVTQRGVRPACHRCRGRRQCVAQLLKAARKSQYDPGSCAGNRNRSHGCTNEGPGRDSRRVS